MSVGARVLLHPRLTEARSLTQIARVRVSVREKAQEAPAPYRNL